MSDGSIRRAAERQARKAARTAANLRAADARLEALRNDTARNDLSSALRSPPPRMSAAISSTIAPWVFRAKPLKRPSLPLPKPNSLQIGKRPEIYRPHHRRRQSQSPSQHSQNRPH